jgi:twinkle protein
VAVKGSARPVKQIIIATDNDAPGRILAADLARWLGPERCKFIEYPEGTKDLNDVLLSYGSTGVAFR